MTDHRDNLRAFTQTSRIHDSSPIDGVTLMDWASINCPVGSASSIREMGVLGKQAEEYLRYCLEHSERYTLIQHGLQIQGGSRTLGELDFLLFDNATAQCIHLEFAYKYYIRVNEAWMGPNLRDSLVQKLKILREKQFPLLYSKECRSEIKKLGIDPQKCSQQLLFLGHLFVSQDVFPSGELVERSTAGLWFRWGDFTDRFYDGELYVLEREEWFLLKMQPTQWHSWEHGLAQIKAIHEKQQSPLVWVRDNASSQLCFVVWW